jgi:hypothetical protein
MMSAKSIARLTVSLQFVLILLVFCSFHLYAHLLITEFVDDNTDQNFNDTYLVAISVETDGSPDHRTLYELARYFEASKAFIRALVFGSNNDEIFSGRIYGRSYRYCYLYISRSLNNKGPP